jgi:spore germination protein GerM
MTERTRRYLPIILAVVLFTALLIGVLSRKKDGRPDPEILSKTSENGSVIEFIRVKFFYFSEASGLMQPLIREIRVPEVREDLYKVFIDLLLSGGSGQVTPLPEGVQLRSVFHLPSLGMLVLDFNDKLISAFPAGTSAELEFIYFIVDNICYNFKEIKKVKLLSGGNENRTLAGHIDLEKPFYPDFSWLKNE